MQLIPRTALGVLFLIGFTLRAYAGDSKWIDVSTTHFTMFTTNGERRAKETLLHFEQVRTFFEKATKIAPKENEVVQIVAFKNDQEFAPYRLNQGSTAYYQHSQSRDFIVMADIEPDHYPVAVHEYTHFVIEHAGLKLPVWLNEGLAELYSTLEPQGDKTMVGRPIPGRMQTLQNTGWLSTAVLVGIREDSPFYRQGDKMQIFYAEAWLLTHMLAMSADYRPHFGDFLAAVSKGESSGDALQRVYGKSFSAIDSDLHSYFNKSTVRVMILPIKLARPDEPVRVTAANDLRLRVTEIQLLVGTNKLDQATGALTTLSKEYPQSGEAEEVWMDLAFHRYDLGSARSHCLRAFDLGSQNSQMLYNCAALSNNSSAGESKVTAILKRLLEVDPGNVDGRLLMASTLLTQNLFGEALTTLSQIKTITPDRASRFYVEQGYAMWRLGNTNGAKNDFELAKKWAKNSDESQRAERYLEAMRVEAEGERRDSPGQVAARPVTPSTTAPSGDATETATHLTRMRRAMGILTLIDCEGSSFRLHLKADQGEQVFLIAKPDDVVIESVDGDVSLTFSCGEKLNRPATVFYAPPQGDVPASSSNGTARKIELQRMNP